MNRMRNAKLYIILPLAAVLSLLIYTACSQTVTEHVPTLSLYMNNAVTDTEALTMVNEALDTYVYDQLGFHVQLHAPANYSQTLRAALENKEQIDVAYLSNMRQLAADGMLHPLDALLETYGQGILDAVDPEYHSYARLDEELYAVATNRDRHEIFGFEYNQEIADQYSLDLSGVDSLEDLTDVFAILHKRAPEIAPIIIVPSSLRYELTDPLEDSYGVLTRDSGTTVVNLYETEHFEQIIRHIYEWSQMGYTLDYSQDAGSVVFYLRSGDVFGCLTFGHVGFEAQESKLCGKQIGFLPLSVSPITPPQNQALAWYGIPTTSADPELAMELLNLLYTDTYAANLLMYGIEGVHYTRDADDPSILRYMDGQTSSSYTGVKGWAYCNQYIADRWEGYEADIWEKMEYANQTAIRSPATGFHFDNTTVTEQIHQCDLVCDEYLISLQEGVLDPDVALPAFRQALKEAGIDEIIAEKQRQLDQFLRQSQ